MSVTSLYTYYATSLEMTITPDIPVVTMTTPGSAVITSITNVITSSTIDSMVTTPPTDVIQGQNDDSGGGVGGIVAGCVVAFILIIAVVVCLIIFLIWYRAKKKGEYTTKSGMTVYPNYLICILAIFTMQVMQQTSVTPASMQNSFN